MMLSAVEKSLDQFSFGDMGFGYDGQASSTVTLQVLDRSSTIDYFGESKPQLRSGIFIQNNCVAMGIMLGIGQLVRYLYMAWLDYHDNRDQQIIRALEQQAHLVVNFYGSNRQRRRLYLSDNSLIPLLTHAKQHIGQIPPWSSEQFAQTLSCVTLQCGDITELWDRLGAEVKIIRLDE